MTIQIYNTLTSKKEAFKPLRDNQVSMYVCGPTVYDSAHVGHAMSAIVFDVIRRFLEYRGYTVKHVMNFTDVEDKIIKRSAELGITPEELTTRHIAEFTRHLKALNVKSPSSSPKVSDEMNAIIAMIEGLVRKEMAYRTSDGSVYFRVAKFPDYGKLSNRTVESDQQASADGSEGKENPRDFALWKASKPGEPFWESPWGKGRPGWHIECSAMAFRHLGEQIDIHGGGNDLIFPHHENEIAQSEGLSGKTFSQFWVHNGMLQLSGEKMSKSIGNLVTIDDFLKDYDADTLRLLILRSKYRSPLAFNPEVLDYAAQSSRRLRMALEGADRGKLPSERMSPYRQRFVEAMEDDFNTASASAVLFDVAREISRAQNEAEKKDLQAILTELVEVLGLNSAEAGAQQDKKLPQAAILQPIVEMFSAQFEALKLPRPAAAEPSIILDALLEMRNQARAAKMWQVSDQIRQTLLEVGITIEDGKDGARWRVK